MLFPTSFRMVRVHDFESFLSKLLQSTYPLGSSSDPRTPKNNFALYRTLFFLYDLCLAGVNIDAFDPYNIFIAAHMATSFISAGHWSFPWQKWILYTVDSSRFLYISRHIPFLLSKLLNESSIPDAVILGFEQHVQGLRSTRMVCFIFTSIHWFMWLDMLIASIHFRHATLRRVCNTV